ncbi:serine hydrolase domain-containing protein [Rhodopirellula sp. SWK7]|uniref:serine hydrolase domain-containing protein n=1 Tax=Rhodopirellula sp. SWK7 TaxID=595460 RepID=UPI0005C4F2E1|nr:serine hydrolase domain-containing protein [Rhodopirellula sp. SWK7]
MSKCQLQKCQCKKCQCNTTNAITRLLMVFAMLVGCRAAAAAQDFSPVQRFLDDAVNEGKVAGGCVLLLHRGEVVFGEGFGFADLETQTPFRLETPVVIASISKPLLGTAAFRIAEHGDVNLSAPISIYLPEFANALLESGSPVGRAPSMIELFGHTSGMRAEGPGGRPWFASWTKGITLEDVVKRYARDYPLKTRPGKRYAYSGIGIDVAARVLEVVANTSRQNMLVTQVAKPLGMKHTFYRDTDSVKLVGPMPTRYQRRDDGTLVLRRKYPVPPVDDYSSSGGSVISTAADLANWLMMFRNNGMHHGERFLESETVEEMLVRVPNSSNSRCGFFVRKKGTNGTATVIGHTGSSGTNCWVNFKEDLVAVTLTQTSGNVKQFRIELEKCINQCIAGRVDSEPSPRTMPR